MVAVEVKRTIKLVTEQHVIDKPSDVEGFPMRSWSIEVYIIHTETGRDVPANIFEKVVYKLHPSFARPVQAFDKPPFRCENEGWGEFDMSIELFTSEKAKNIIPHDLNFSKERYEAQHTITFKNPNPVLANALRESGPVPGDDANGAVRKNKADSGKAQRKKTAVDMEKLGENLVKLQEDDLLYVVQLIHDNKTEDTYTLNDPDAGEFHVDLYTLPDKCIKLLNEYVNSKIGLS